MEYTAESKDLLKAQSIVCNHIFSVVKSMSLKCAMELGIPDAIHSNGGEPISLRELANKLSIPSARVDGLRRLMRLLVHSGFFAFQESKKGEGDGDGESNQFFLPTINSALLLRENNATVSPPFLITLDRTFMLPWHSWSKWFRQPEVSTAFEIEHGDCLWTFTKKNAGFGNRFNEGMARDARYTGELVVKECADVFRGLQSVVDVGGGTGDMARAIANAFPHVQFTVFDLPQVVAGLKEENGKIAFVRGDMFEYVPPADAALLKWILHDWSDEDCVKILKRCKEAVPSKEKGGKVIIIDMVMDKGSTYFECDETQVLFDLQMMVITPGKERNEKEWSKIFTSAGYKEYKIMHVLGLRSVIEVYH